MNNIDFTGMALMKLIGIAGAAVLAINQLTFSGGVWKGTVDAKLQHIEQKIDTLDKKTDRNFDLLITEIRSLKK